MARHPLHGLGVEQGGAVLEFAREGAVGLPQGDDEVEPDRQCRGRLVGVVRSVALLGCVGWAGLSVVVVEEDLEEGAAGAVALDGQLVDHLLEGQVLMGVGAQGRLAYASEQFPEGRVAGEVRPHDEGVDEEPDQVLGLGAVAVGHGGSEDDVVRSGVPAEQDVHGGEQRHRQGGAAFAGQVAQSSCRLRRDPEVDGAAVAGAYGWAGAVRRQLQQGCTGQLVAPVGELFLQYVPFQPPALPDGEVGVLHRQRRQRVRRTRTERVVQGGDLIAQDAAGPVVGHDVVEREREQMVVGGDLDEGAADQGSCGQVERQTRVRFEDRPGGCPRVRFGGHVDQRQGEGRRLVDHLVCDTVLVGDQAGPEHLVPGHHRGQGLVQGGEVQVAGPAQGGGQVVLGGTGLQLVQEPEALLRERQGQSLVPVDGGDRRNGRVGGGAVHGGGEFPDGRPVEQCGQGDLGPEHLADPGDHLGGEQRVSAQVEEVVLGAHSFHAEDLRPHLGEDALGLGARCHQSGRVPAHAVRCGEGGAVELAVRREGEFGQFDDDGRHHVLGQSRGDVRAQLGRRRGALVPVRRHEVGHQAAFAALAVRRDHRGPDTRVGGENGLDLARFDTETPHLELLVGAAEELHASVGQSAHAVAGPVHPRAVRAERVGQEPFGGEGRAATVAARDLYAGDEQLARHAHGYGSQRRVQDVDPGVGQGPAQRDHSGVEALGRQRVGEHADRGLGRPVVVDDGAVLGGLDERGQPLG